MSKWWMDTGMKLPGQKKQWVEHSPEKWLRVKGVALVCGCTVAATHWGHWQETSSAQEAYGDPGLSEGTCL